MAKESMKAREVKRAKLVAKYAEKRAALKQIVRTGDPADAFEAAQKLQELPKNSNPIPIAMILKDINCEIESEENELRKIEKVKQGMISKFFES